LRCAEKNDNGLCYQRGAATTCATLQNRLGLPNGSPCGEVALGVIAKNAGGLGAKSSTGERAAKGQRDRLGSARET
jgi:hypothetical protein